MKRKLFCILSMLAGAACIVATIILSGGRSQRSDASPVYTLIFLSMVMIAAAAWVFSNELRGAVLKWIFRVFSILASLAGSALILITSFKANVVLMPIFFFFAISIASVTVAAWSSDEETELKVSASGTIFLWIFRVFSTLAILACLAFIIIMWVLTDNYKSDGMSFYNNGGLNNVFSLMALASAGIALAALSLKLRAPISGTGKTKAIRCAPIAAALAIVALLGFVYINCIPKYSVKDGLNIILSNPEHAQKDVLYYNSIPRDSQVHFISTKDKNYEEIIPFDTLGSNPFYETLFEYDCYSYRYDADGLHIETGYILFNPATGAHEYMHTQQRDITYSPGDWPRLDGDLIHDYNGGHGAVLNLYFGEWLPGEAPRINRSLPVARSQWDAMLKDIMYTHNFPEDDAQAFLKSIGEEALKTKISELISSLDTRFKNEAIEVFFYGIDIATYQNEEIILKL